MPEISRFFGIIVSIFYDEHNPPHFHARYNEYKITININDLSILEGSFPPRAMGILIEWAMIHRSELKQEWDLAMDQKELFPIEPLK